MRVRPSRRALGLRGRILGAVLFTAVATLAVAALTLLGPLEQSLRHAELNTLRSEVGSTKRANATSFERTIKAFGRRTWDLVAEADVEPIDQVVNRGRGDQAGGPPSRLVRHAGRMTDVQAGRLSARRWA